MSQEPQNQNPQNQNPNPNPEVPVLPAGDDALDKIKRENQRIKEERDALLKQMDDLKIKTHKDQNNWKEVAEINEQKAADAEKKFSGLQSALINEKKMNALSIEAQKQGINPASLPDLEMLDFDEIHVETTSTGKILVSGADKAISTLKVQRPHWFSKAVPPVNTATPRVNVPEGQSVTLADVNAAEAQWKKSKSESDKQIYFETIMKFKSQR